MFTAGPEADVCVSGFVIAAAVVVFKANQVHKESRKAATPSFTLCMSCFPTSYVVHSWVRLLTPLALLPVDPSSLQAPQSLSFGAQKEDNLPIGLLLFSPALHPELLSSS